tara:strand:+ start:295 stop:597 length:303 start_codon:yes stop_codon:yes gene_type:complete
MNTLKLTDSELEVLHSFYEIGMNMVTKDYVSPEPYFESDEIVHKVRQNMTLTMLKDHDVEINKDVVWLKIWNLLDPEGEFAEPPDDRDEDTGYDIREFMS